MTTGTLIGAVTTAAGMGVGIEGVSTEVDEEDFSVVSGTDDVAKS